LGAAPGNTGQDQQQTRPAGNKQAAGNWFYYQDRYKERVNPTRRNITELTNHSGKDSAQIIIDPEPDPEMYFFRYRFE